MANIVQHHVTSHDEPNASVAARIRSRASQYAQL